MVSKSKTKSITTKIKISNSDKQTIFQTVKQKFRNVTKEDIEDAFGKAVTVGAGILSTAEIIKKILKEIRKMKSKKE